MNSRTRKVESTSRMAYLCEEICFWFWIDAPESLAGKALLSLPLQQSPHSRLSQTPRGSPPPPPAVADARGKIYRRRRHPPTRAGVHRRRRRARESIAAAGRRRRTREYLLPPPTRAGSTLPPPAVADAAEGRQRGRGAEARPLDGGALPLGRVRAPARGHAPAPPMSATAPP